MKVKLQVPVSPAWQRALARAAADRLAGRVPERIACRTYRIVSGSGNPDHIVTIQSVVNLQATCDCIGAQRGMICRHQAACLDAALTRIAHSDAAPEPTPARIGGAEIDAKMLRFSRV
jgi:hypothetical protein